MNKQEYRHIHNLSLDLLIDAKISKLPVDITKIARVYDLQHLINNDRCLYDNTLCISKKVLIIYGFTNPEFIKHLTMRILSPMIVLKELNIKSAKELSSLSGLPANLANQRFKRFEMLLSRNAFQTSRLETIVLSQFQNWIDNY